MPLTAAQWSEQNILNSIAAYINEYVVVPYNSTVASTSYPATLGYQLEKPSDPQWSPSFPLIVICHPGDSTGPRSTGIGDGTLWYYENITLRCYPALDTSNTPNQYAATILRNLVKYALGTALFIPIWDYTQNPAVKVEVIQVMNVRLTKPSGRDDLILSIDKYRFDYQLDVRYTVAAING